MPRGGLSAALDGKRRAYASYRKAKKLSDRNLYDTAVFGPRLYKFTKTLAHFDIEASRRLIEYCRKEWEEWMSVAPEEIQFAALQAVDERIMTIREKAGLPVLDDPMPGEPDSVFLTIKKMFGFTPMTPIDTWAAKG